MMCEEEKAHLSWEEGTGDDSWIGRVSACDSWDEDSEAESVDDKVVVVTVTAGGGN